MTPGRIRPDRRWLLGLVVVAALASPALVWADDASQEIAVVPIVSRWVPAGDRALIAEVLSELGREHGARLTAVSGPDLSRCWADDACYLEGTRELAEQNVLVVEAKRTSSGRLYLTLRLIDVRSGALVLKLKIRSRAGLLGRRLSPTVEAILAALPAPALAGPALPEEPATVGPAPLPPSVRPIEPRVPPPPEPWYRSISAHAFVSSSYTYNLGRPDGGTSSLRVFDPSHNNLSIDVAELVVERTAEDPGDAGFRFDLTAGAAIPRVAAAAGLFRDADGNAQDVDLQQAFVTYTAPFRSGIKADFGKFVTHAGAELIEGYDGFNDNYSRSLLFGYAIPFTHTGIRVSYPFHDRVAAMAMVVNGWDNVTDNNDGKTLGAQLTVLPATDLSLYLNYLGGPELPDDNRSWRHLVDVVATLKLWQLTFGVNIDYAREKQAAPVVWMGVSGSVRWDPGALLAVALRGEYFDDSDGARTGTPQRVSELTLTHSLRVAAGCTVRIEARYDHSTAEPFLHGARAVSDQVTAAVNAVLAI